MLGKTKFLAFMKRHGVTRQAACQYYSKQEVNQLLKEPMTPKQSKRAMLKINSWPYSFQADVIAILCRQQWRQDLLPALCRHPVTQGLC
jgi:hypothetical protein